MLVVISDLHFTDGTTSNTKIVDGEPVDQFNIKPTAFRLLYQNIAGIIERKNKTKKQISEVTFVYAGDIFDYLRTNVWFETTESERPWAVPLNTELCYKSCTQIVEATIAHNETALQWLRGDHPEFQEIWPQDVNVRRLFIPGNHDRIANLHSPLIQLVREKLLGETGVEIFPNKIVDEAHRTIVVHGHEADPFNCESNNNQADYAKIPIGDMMTTMLFARLPYLAKKEGLPDDVVARFRDLDNVRPAFSGVLYVADIVKDHPQHKKAINKIVDRTVSDFMDTQFYKEWDDEHDVWGFDITTQLSAALTLIKLIGTDFPAGKIEKFSKMIGPDSSMEKWAQKVINQENKAGKDIRYAIMGHTHDPVYVSLKIEKKIENHYLNSGTFRTTYVSTFDKETFSRQQRISCAIVYKSGEFGGDGETQVYELWSGQRKRN